MKRKCIICGRKLRTGIKYCYDCKTGARVQERKKQKELGKINLELGLSLISLFALSYFIYISLKRSELLFGIAMLILFLIILWYSSNTYSKDILNFKSKFK